MKNSLEYDEQWLENFRRGFEEAKDRLQFNQGEFEENSRAIADLEADIEDRRKIEVGFYCPHCRRKI